MPDEDSELLDALATLSLVKDSPTRKESPLRVDSPSRRESPVKPLFPDRLPLLTLSPAVSEFYKLSSAVSLPGDAGNPRITVIFAPLAHKHVFSRPWVSKRAISTIVERPERLNACALGVGAARTVMPLKLQESWRRTSLLSPHVVAVHGKEWADELYALAKDVANKLADGDLEVPDSWPSGDIYLGPESIAALEGAVGAIEDGINTIFKTDEHATRRAFVCVRPPGHHCHESAASGFCLINNAHIAIQYARIKHNITHAVVLDFDLHHGDGTQDLCWKLSFNNDGEATFPVGYFSIHDVHSFPTEKGYADPERIMRASTCLAGHGMAIWNVHLQPFGSEEEFHMLYERQYSILFIRAAAFLSQAEKMSKEAGLPFNPLVVISAGFDGSEYETKSMQRHQVSVPTSFFNRFTLDCGHLAERYSSGRILSLLEGGYSTQALATGVFSHLTGLAGKTWKHEWSSTQIAEDFLKGSRQRWKQGAQWPAEGIRLGRVLFPKPVGHIGTTDLGPDLGPDLKPPQKNEKNQAII